MRRPRGRPVRDAVRLRPFPGLPSRNDDGYYNRRVDAWGKFDEESGRIHRLEHHCADVAACFEALLREPVLRARFVQAAGAGGFTDATAARLTYLAFLHDFGKLNTGFQFKVRRNGLPRRRLRPAGHIAEALLCFDRSEFCELLGLYDIAEHWGPGVEPLLRAMLAHHGRPASRPTRSGSGPPELWESFGGYDPRATTRQLGRLGRSWFPDAFADGLPLPDAPALAHLFAGVVALADQLGSDEDVFEYESTPDPRYIDHARHRAARTVEARGFRRRDWAAGAAVADIGSLFGHPVARPLQRAVPDAPFDRPLLILESETGSGKTEAAVLRFAALWRAGLVDGLYFAVPTRAAAKQLHGRIERALKRLFPPDARVQTVLAVPGYLRAGDAEGRRTGRFDVYWEDESDDEKTRLARWSAESSRKFLSAPAAVGTVDQVLLAGLRVKWAHFRAASLSRSLLVVDEVHASDAYMTELLRGVLQGHLALGGHAMLMSATLGAAARSKFVSRAARSSLPTPTDAESIHYPALTLVPADGAPETHAIMTSGPGKSVSMSAESILGDADAIARMAATAARDGAKVLVIRNTVASAQAVFDVLLTRGGPDVVFTAAGGPALHHSRFAAEDRHLLDDAVERVLGASPRPPGGIVVIGTQTLEQSLDIDADLLVTDLCPVDVLLQRIGRLHRHQRTNRPARFRDPRCRVLVPEAGIETGLGGSLLRHGLGVSDRGGIYENLLTLEATRRLIADHATWTIPAMNRMLVECATHPDVLRKFAEALGEAWVSHETRVSGRRAAKGGVARNHALTRNEPFDDNLVFPDLDERVRTRLGEDGPRIVLAEPVTGPFGGYVRTFNLPAHLFRGGLPTKEQIAAARADPGPENGLLLRVGEHVLTYDRTGVRAGVDG